MAGRMSKWLKKYMKIEFLESTLKKQALFLGDPSKWIDLNDAAVLNAYKNRKNLSAIRATCLTRAQDRYHFWAIFGEEKKGVCLWFSADKFIEDVRQDRTLQANDVGYYTLPELKSVCDPCHLPFAKRKQYEDEREYRVVREYAFGMSGEVKGVKFRPESLARIYLNSWLNDDEFKKEKSSIERLLTGPYEHVRLHQNKVRDYSPWIHIVNDIARS